MALAVIEGYTRNTTEGTSSTLTLTKPTGVAVGDLLVMICGNENSGNGEGFSPHAGWVQMCNLGSANEDCYLSVFYRVADGTEGASETLSQGADDGHGWYFRISGADPTNPINVASAGMTGVSIYGSTGDVQTTAPCLAIGALAYDGADTTFKLLTTGTWANLDVLQSPLGSSGGNGSSGVVATLNQSTAGWVGTTWLITNDGWAGFCFAINGVAGETIELTTPGVQIVAESATVGIAYDTIVQAGTPGFTFFAPSDQSFIIENGMSYENISFVHELNANLDYKDVRFIHAVEQEKNAIIIKRITN